MQLIDILNSLEQCEVFGDVSVDIKGITDNSKKVKNGFLFIAIKGLTVDGHLFIDEAIKSGAAAVSGTIDYNPKWSSICYIKVSNSRLALAKIASVWYGNPSERLLMIGVTGTKGKTTTATLIYSIFVKAGLKCALVTSNNAIISNKKIDTGFHVTNPEPMELHSLLRKMLDAGVKYCVLEVTSHGLDQERVSSIKFDSALLTNISHEHLDYHKKMRNYILAKSKLFQNCNYVVLNADDSQFDFFKKVAKNSHVVTYSVKEKHSDYLLLPGKENVNKQEFSILTEDQKFNFLTTLLGDFNLENIAAAVALSRIYGISWEKIGSALLNFPGIEGRLQEVKNSKGINIYIDFAHTPDSLEKILLYLRRKTKGNLVCVFGCAAERDTMKRPIMGRISTQLSNISIFTAEDPRYEDINLIIDEIENGVDKAISKYINVSEKPSKSLHSYYKIPERGDAITFAISKLARKGDTIVICGKGHEKSMNYNGIEYPWSDRKAVEYALRGQILNIDRNA